MTDSEVFHHYTSEHLGISVQTQDQIKIGPSPTNDIFSISAGVRWLNANVDIYNMEERLLFSTVMNQSNLDISMQKFKSGYYIVSLNKGDQTFHSKLILIRE